MNQKTIHRQVRSCQQTVFNLAERVGFEPTLPCGKRALQARALGQTTLSLPNVADAIIP